MDFREPNINTHLPLVTIGVLSYNYSMYIIDALNSLLTQTYANIELIIIDDCSIDNCPQLIEDWIKQHNINCVFIKHAQNLGITKTSNEIVKLSKGKYLNLFATDDIMLPEKIERQVKILEEAGEEYGMCYAHPHFIDAQNEILSSATPEIKIEGDVLIQYVKREFKFITPTSLIRKSVYKNVGMYDERVLIEDYNFFLRLVSCYKVKYCNYPCLFYRKKDTESVIFNRWNENNGERYYYDRILSNLGGLRLIENKQCRRFLKNKITQYLKRLAINNSALFYSSLGFLLKHGYVKYSWIIMIKVRQASKTILQKH